jgi:N-acyl-D-aspartate/D-glutamate deacylase
MVMHELVIRGGTVVDGTGADARTADVAIEDGRVTEVGRVDGSGRREIVADGLLVTPGFVDIHTHYDGQATWDGELAPSSWHGVTTAVMGNCGVGFAPVRVRDRERLVELMEGVEDIPGTALHEGLPWEWESFAEYLDFLEGIPRDLDLAAQVPHGALRYYVMGERATGEQPATLEDIAEMAALARGAVEAGALGFSTSRTLVHKSSKGERIPSLAAEAAELIAIGEALGAAGAGVLQVVSDFIDVETEFAMLRDVASRSGRPMSMTVLQSPYTPEVWRDVLARVAAANAEGLTIRGQVGARAVGLLLGFEATLNPFMMTPTWRALAGGTVDERLIELHRPEVRRALIAEMALDRASPVLGSRLICRFDMMYALGDPPCYEPAPDTCLAEVARRDGRDAAEVAYDVMLSSGGRGLIYLPTANFVERNLDVVGEQLRDPNTVAGLSDGGAHVGTICDVSFPTTLLQWWGRDRPDGKLPVPLLVHKQTMATARAVGLDDRGVLAPGYRGDVNVIDFEQLAVHTPEFAYDLPAGGRRLLQRATGYVHTFVAGSEIRAGDESTGARPGRLVRGAQTRPA